MERDDLDPVATFYSGDSFSPGATVTLSGEAAHHIRVARVAVGDAVALRDGAGCAALGTLVRAGRTSAMVDVHSVRELPRPAPIHLLAPVADRERMLWLAEKVTELGVTSWRPVMWRRSKSVSPRGEGPMFQAKVKARMVSAMLQSGGGWLPDLFPEATVERAVAAAPLGTRMLLDRDGEPIAAIPFRGPVTIALGPEGGMEPAERDVLIGVAFLPVRLAPNTLRFETAGVAAVAIAASFASSSRQPNG